MGLFTDSLQLLKQDPGENPNIWGDTHNDQFIDLCDEAVAGAFVKDVTGLSDYTLNDDPGVSNESRPMLIHFFNFPLAGIFTVNVPARQKLYAVNNNTPQTLSIKPQGGVGVSLPPQTQRWVTIDETLNQAFLLEATGRFHVLPFIGLMNSATGTVENSGGVTLQVNWSFEGSTFAIGWDDFTATVTATTRAITGAFPTPPERPQSFQLYIEDSVEANGVMDAYATFTANRIEFFVSASLAGAAWTNPSTIRIQQTFLQFNIAEN